ncbi:MAG TPA: RNA polymerase sigma factor [Vicinamibacterales bacterium]|nr:RNA polymerase sigma factor [Vicinamibacterales bacterium]
MSAPADALLASRTADGDEEAFEALMRRFNQKLFRVARSILKNDADAEDVLQEAYLQAYRRMSDFRGDAQLGTWLTRIVINQALMRLRADKRDRVVVSFSGSGDDERDLGAEIADEKAESPTDAALRGEIRRLLEHHIDALPMPMRTVLVMRDVEEMSVQETADCLGIPPATVRTRLFRARAMLRDMLARDTDAATLGLFGFDGVRCDRIVAGVLARIRAAG